MNISFTGFLLTLSFTTQIDHSDENINIEGYAKEIGAADYNLNLSEKPAEYIIHYHVKKGIAKDRLVKKYYGITKPATNNKTTAGRALNRRVKIKVFK